MKTLIFSDVHLSVANEAGVARLMKLVEFLRWARGERFERVIVLGDLFDFWFEYRHVIFSGYFEVLRALADLRDDGVELHFFCGNHDFWAGRFLEQDLHFKIHRDSAILRFGSQRALLVHGDGVRPEDWPYRAYKRVARNPAVVWLFGLLHPDWAMALGRLISGGSRHFFMAKDLSQGSEVTPLRAFAERVLADGAADVVLCGHSHYPERTEFPTPTGTGLYINAGDWLFHSSYVIWDAGAFTISRFGVEPKEISDGDADSAEAEN